MRTIVLRLLVKQLIRNTMARILLVFFIVLVFIAKIMCEEPRCSSFDYEERTLEKMIRIEFTVKEMLREFKATKHDVKNELASFREVKDQIQDEVAKIKNKVFEAEDYNLQSWRELRNLVTAQNETLSNLKGSVSEHQVIFRAKDIQNKQLQDGEVIIFPTAELNEGQGYDKTTGYFTAPVAGYYFLLAQICVKPTNYIYLNIVVDDKTLTKWQASAQHYNYCTSWSTIAQLNIGSKACIKGRRSVSASIFQTQVYHGNLFSGFLLR